MLHNLFIKWELDKQRQRRIELAEIMHGEAGAQKERMKIREEIVYGQVGMLAGGILGGAIGSAVGAGAAAGLVGKAAGAIVTIRAARDK